MTLDLHCQAAVLSERFQSMEGMGRVGVVLSGGNVDLDNL